MRVNVSWISFEAGAPKQMPMRTVRAEMAAFTIRDVPETGSPFLKVKEREEPESPFMSHVEMRPTT